MNQIDIFYTCEDCGESESDVVQVSRARMDDGEVVDLCDACWHRLHEQGLV